MSRASAPTPPPSPPLPADATTTGLGRPSSVWPEPSASAATTAEQGWASTRPSLAFAPSRFDPLADERARLQTQAAAAFDVCHPALALRALFGVQIVLALVALVGADSVAEWGSRQALVAFAGAAGTVVWLVGVCALRPVLARVPAAARAGTVLGLGAAAALLAALPLWWAELAPGGALRAVGVALAGTAFAAVLWAWLDLRARIWHPATASARLAELQSRIRPHFLFNALNTALALVRVDPARAEAVLEDLAQLFRVALAEVGAAVTLQEEIELARRYLDIEQVRFGNRLAVQWEVDPRVGQARVPPLVLQPLVENAVRHGIEPARRGGRVVVRGRVQRGQAVVTVSNTLGDEPGQPGHGMALHNVRERLRLLHDVAAQCDVWRGPDGSTSGGSGSGGDGSAGGEMFHARIVLPLP